MSDTAANGREQLANITFRLKSAVDQETDDEVKRFLSAHFDGFKEAIGTETDSFTTRDSPKRGVPCRLNSLKH